MNRESLEHLSSLMDGELSRETGLFMARRLTSDDELSMTWRRYHLIRDCIRRQAGHGIFVDIAGSVSSTIAAAETETGTRRGRSWLKPAAGFAVAASVALMAIMAVGPTPPSGSGMTGTGEMTAAQSFDSPNALPAGSISQPASYSNSAANTRLNSYLLRHNQLARAAGRQGFVSFVPIIAASAQEQESDSGTEANQAAETDSTVVRDPEPRQ
jgi:sigma-E factor negative regulatory protein RseA